MAKRPCILARSAAASLVSEELDAIYILENAGTYVGACFFEWNRFNATQIPIFISFHELMHIALVSIGFTESQFFNECFADHFHISILAKYQWNYHPIIFCPYLAIGPVVAHERSVLE